MTLAPERLEALKNQHGMDADEAQELFSHIEGLEEAVAALREGALDWKRQATRRREALEQVRTGLANLPNPDASPNVTEAIDALYHFVNATLAG